MQTATKPLNLLIVDDSAMMRALLTRAARLSGIPLAAVLEAANGEEALALLETQAVDALFTDLTMPVMTGLELLRAIDERQRWPALLRVVISSDGSSHGRVQAEGLNAVRYVEKPFRPEAIRDVLATLL